MWQKPIFDRTNADTFTARAGQSNIDNHKGALNYQDLNRIEGNFQYVVQQLFDNAMVIPHKLRNYTETVLEYVQTGEAGPEYSLMEHLESTGTQCIDTLYKWTSETTKIEMGFEYVGSPNAVSLFGSEVAEAQYSGVPWGNSASSFQMFVGTSKSIAQTNVSTNSNIDLVVSTSGGELTVTINGTTQTTTFSGSVQNGRDIAIFANNSSTGVTQHSKLKLKYFKMTDDGIVVRDFIPVLDFKKVACLFDKVEKKYYYNAGTGTFTAGAEVPVEVEPIYELVEISTTYNDWQEQNIPWLSEIDRIRDNYNNLVTLFLHNLGLPVLASSQYLMYDEVNDWERIAFVGRQMFENMEYEYVYSNTIDSGGDRLL